MSQTAAIAYPLPSTDGTPRRHLEVAPTRAQRRARPRLYAALTAVLGIVVILIVQLLMSILLADGAYRIAELQGDRRDLVRDQHAAQESLEQLSSTQSLLMNAEALGMVSSGNPIFLDVGTGTALGTVAGRPGQLVGVNGNMIGNALLADGSTLLDPAAIAASRAGEVGSLLTTPPPVAPTTPEAGVTPVAPTAGTLPSPTTR